MEQKLLTKLKKLNKKELVVLAETNAIVIEDTATKKEIIQALEDAGIEDFLKNYFEGDSNMNEELRDEMITTEEVDTNLPEGNEEKVEKKATETWTLKDGTPCSKSAFIREKFQEDNMSRKEISDTYDIPYRTVYGATANMENDAEPSSRGRSAVNAKIHVTPDHQHVAVTTKEGATLYDGEAVAEDFELPELVEVDRNEWIREMVEAGSERGEIAKALDVSYGVVYAASKDLGGARKNHMVEYEGKQIPRTEYIRMRFAAGVSKSDIAKELDVPYSVVWTATKVEKTDEEKYFDHVEALEKFADKLEEGQEEKFKELIGALKDLKVKEEEKEEVKEEEKEEEKQEEPAV